MTNPYAPDEPPSQIFSEKSWLQGALLSNIFYGVELTLFMICFTILARQVTRVDYKRQLVLLVFITVIFALGTIFMGTNVEFTQLAFIDNRNYPGGPGAYEQAMFWIPVDELGNVAFVLGNWLMDLLLESDRTFTFEISSDDRIFEQVWRCMVIYSGTSGTSLWAIMLLPCLLFLASFSKSRLLSIRKTHLDAVLQPWEYCSSFKPMLRRRSEPWTSRWHTSS